MQCPRRDTDDHNWRKFWRVAEISQDEARTERHEAMALFSASRNV
jgi:hypothetical protein